MLLLSQVNLHEIFHSLYVCVAWERFWIPPEELEEECANTKAACLCSYCCLCDLTLKKAKENGGWMSNLVEIFYFFNSLCTKT